MARRTPIASRLWAKVAWGSPLDCWEWTGAKNPAGYGRVWDGDKMVLAHRAAWEIVIAPLSDDVDLDHLCRNPACVNPAHLDPVDHRENVLRGVGATAQNARKEECVNGHPFTPENTIIRRYTSGRLPSRQCRTCKNHWEQARRRARRAEARATREKVAQ